MVGMMVAGMFLPQVLVIGLILFIPPQPSPAYPASVVASLLAGGTPLLSKSAPLARRTSSAEPNLPPDRTRQDSRSQARLAALMHRSVQDVRFYIVRDPRWLESIEDIWRLQPPRGRHRPDAPPAGPPPPASTAGALPWLSDPDFPFFGHFVAAARVNGIWTVVEPVGDGGLSQWQARLLLSLLGGAIVIAPAGYLFARRITAPLQAFAEAAQRLGSDPTSPPVVLQGPAELGRAAEAFNDMQLRLRRYVADRTAMFGAISHDLRTPLARLRFKMERAPAPLKSSALQDLDQMDAMIASVLSFLRDGAASGRRQRLELSSLVELVVDQELDAGGPLTFEDMTSLPVLGDASALRRMLANLVRNAVLHGGGAHVETRRENGDAIVEIRDQGPGLPVSELERVFEPFYRADKARNLDAGGVGLGLAIARAIARDHGGEVTLHAHPVGLSVLVRLPLDRTP